LSDQQQPSQAGQQIDPNLIRLHDGYGREIYITKEVWRTKVLPETLQSNWNTPDELYEIIVGSLRDGFCADIVKAAQHLYEIDPQHARATAVWGIVLMEQGNLDEAETVFHTFISQHGENGIILTNLAKVFAKRKDDSKAEETLWRSLELDPNQDNAMGWYYAVHRERGGDGGAREALRTIAAIPGSWRAQLWLAGDALQARRLEEARSIYQECLARVGKPVPIDLLMQMSADLGKAGFLPELLQLCEPHFVAETHGLQVGNNLIKAHLESGQIEAASRILNELYALRRPDWRKSLGFWDTEIARTRRASSSAEQKPPLSMTFLSVAGPVWLDPSSPAAKLFPAKAPDGLGICLLGSSAEAADNSESMQPQSADARGRLSRALPLFLAEQIDLNSSARVQTLVPWIAQERGGFVLYGRAWTDELAANAARQGRIVSDYVVTTHLKCQTEPWTLELRLIRIADETCIGNLTTSFPCTRPEEVMPQFSRLLLDLLVEQAKLQTSSPAPLYQVPAGTYFPYYLLRLEQLLAVRCGGMDGVRSNFLSGEREIIDGTIELCLAFPQNLAARLVLAQVLSGMKKIRPDILPEFKSKLEMLQKEQPLPQPARGVVQLILDEALAA
jgi:tetratricopeptide (TPR) repeat protein